MLDTDTQYLDCQNKHKQKLTTFKQFPMKQKMKINANNNQPLFNTFPETVSSQYSIKTFYSIPPLFSPHCREAVGFKPLIS